MNSSEKHSGAAWSRSLARLALQLAGLALLALVLVQAWQVFARYVLNASPGWTEPLSVLLLATLMSLSAAAAVHADSHFSFRLLSEAGSARRRRAAVLLQQGLICLLGLILAGWAVLLMLDGIAVKQAGIVLPQGSVHAPLAVGGMLMALFAAERAWLAWRAPDGGQR